MKRLVIGDPHFKVSNLSDCYLFIDKINKIIDEYQPNEVVVLGDMHDAHEKVHALVLTAITTFFIGITAKGVKVKYIIGNHDLINNKVFCENLHVFNSFKYINGIQIIDVPYWENGAAYIPYTEPGRFQEAISRLDPLPYNLVFCHQEFNGVQLGPKKSQSPDVWPINAPQLYSGHIHDYHYLQPNLCYVGAPFDHEFTNNPAPRHVIILENSEDSPIAITLIPMDMPRKRIMHLTGEEFLKLDAKALSLGDPIKILVSINSEALHALKKTKKYIELSKIAKIIPQITDKVHVRSSSAFGKKTYLQLLAESIKQESETVQKMFEELHAKTNIG